MLRKNVGFFWKKKPLLYFPPQSLGIDLVDVQFTCLLSEHQWNLDDSSNVFIRFNANDLGTSYTCHGPMNRLKRFVFADML